MEPNKNLWVHKYRPDTTEHYMFKDETLKKNVEKWIETGVVPNLLLYGPAGTGKTSLINVITHGLIGNGFISEHDIMEIDASTNTSIQMIRDEVSSFANTQAEGKFRLIILEEFEGLSHQAQKSLKRVTEQASEAGNAVFFFTTNEVEKINPAMFSRTHDIELKEHNKETYTRYIIDVLTKENVKISTPEQVTLLQHYIDYHYPDVRKILNTLQENVDKDGNLLKLDNRKAQYQELIIHNIQNGTIVAAREEILKNITAADVGEFFEFLYRNLNLWYNRGANIPNDMLDALLIVKIRDGLVKANNCGHWDINLAATLCELDNISRGI